MINFYEYGYGLDKEGIYGKELRQWRLWDCNYPYVHITSILKRSPYYAYMYANSMLKCRWLEAEPIIMEDPYSAVGYARTVIKDRWYEAEMYIMKSPGWATEYARYVIKGRWVEAEQVIMKSPMHAYRYAEKVLKRRWVEAEMYIKPNKEVWQAYCKEFGHMGPNHPEDVI